MEVIIIPVFILLFSLLAYKRWSPILLGPTVALLLVLVARLPVLDTMLGPYLQSSASFVQNNFFVFFLGAIFGGMMEATNAAKSIAVCMSKITKKRFVLPLIMTITGILAYGGVSGFVVYFAMYPIALHLCKEANISRALIPGAIASGCWTWAMSMPGAPSIPNVVAMKYLGTPSTADMVGGFLFAGLFMYIAVFFYLEWQNKRYTAKGLVFVPDAYVEEELSKNADKELPHPGLAFLPIVVILVLFNVLGVAIEFSLLAGVVLTMATMFKYGGSLSDWLAVCNKGATNSATVILNTAMVVGFAGVMRQTNAFSLLVENLGKIDLPALVFVLVTVALCAGSAASASGGMGVALEAFGDVYLAAGIPAEVIHRVAVVAVGTFDSLPHAGGQVTLLNICRQTHKEAYSHMFVTQCIIPLIASILLVIFHTITM